MARRRVEIENNRSNQPMQGRLFTPQEPSGGAVLFIHGHGSGARGRNNEQYAKRIVGKGVTSLTFDLGGHGGSNEWASELTVNDHLADTGHAYDFLSSVPGVDKDRIGIAGMSYGGYLAVLLSANRSAKSLLLRSPPLYPHELRDKRRDDYTDEEALRSEPDPDNSALEAMRDFAGKVVLVDAAIDQIVPVEAVVAYRDNAHNVETWTLPVAGHQLNAQSQRAFNPIVTEWATSL